MHFLSYQNYLQIELDESQYFQATQAHRIGLYCEVDPCPILYDFSPGVDTVVSLDSFRNKSQIVEQTSALFEKLLHPLVFAVALCASKGKT